MPDLTIDAGSTDALTGALAWLASGDRLTQFLRDAIKVNLAPTLEKARVLAEKNLNRELAPGLVLKTTLTSAQPVGVWAAPDALVARVIVKGHGVHRDPPGVEPADSTPPAETGRTETTAPKPPARPLNGKRARADRAGPFAWWRRAAGYFAAGSLAKSLSTASCTASCVGTLPVASFA